MSAGNSSLLYCSRYSEHQLNVHFNDDYSLIFSCYVECFTSCVAFSPFNLDSKTPLSISRLVRPSQCSRQCLLPTSPTRNKTSTYLLLCVANCNEGARSQRYITGATKDYYCGGQKRHVLLESVISDPTRTRIIICYFTF